MEDLNLSKCSLHCRMIGCGLEGKLFERAWKEVFVFKEEDAIFLQERRGVEKIEGRIEPVDLPFFHCHMLHIYKEQLLKRQGVLF